ncbi:DUF2946 domain-containing protein [Rhodoferax sp.]|uniref:DUF2946 domain-containing protein n=1 Tax=Rhodoferax sp. TaxID=50421 RepID=UPI00345C0171
MTRLRHAKLLARFVLVWFALSVAAAIASPLVKPQALELICSGTGGMRLLPGTDEGGQPTSRHTLDCPLCVGVGAPPPESCGAIAAPQAFNALLVSVPKVVVAARTAASLPARGPPASF